MSKVFFGFAVADSMFPDECSIRKTTLTVREVEEFFDDGVIPCLNPSHLSTIKAMEVRYPYLKCEIPPTPPRVALEVGDSVIVMGVRGLPRLTDRHEYTDAEIASATFVFSLYHVGE